LRVFETEVGRIFRTGGIVTFVAGAFSVSTSQMLNGIILGEANGVNTLITLPTGATIDSAVPGLSANDTFSFKVLNTSVVNNFQFDAVAGLTFYGSNTIQASTSKFIWVKKTAANTFSVIL
jgi:hypothetical protein